MKATPAQVRKWLRGTRGYSVAISEVTWAAVAMERGGAPLPIVVSVTAVHVESGYSTTERLAITDVYGEYGPFGLMYWPVVVSVSKVAPPVPKPAITKELRISADPEKIARFYARPLRRRRGK